MKPHLFPLFGSQLTRSDAHSPGGRADGRGRHRGYDRRHSSVLTAAEQDQVARDMDWPTFYQLKLDEVAAISHRLVLDRWVIENLPGPSPARPIAAVLDEQISNKITVLALGTH
jgi:hypothetical protein